MTIIQRNKNGEIITFMEKDAGTVLAEGETLEEVPGSFADFASRLVLSVDGITGLTVQKTIGDTLQVEVACPGKKTIDLLVNGKSTLVKLIDGRGSLTLDCDTRRIIEIEPADQKTYCPGGEARLTVQIGEPITLAERVAELEKLAKK